MPPALFAGWLEQWLTHRRSNLAAFAPIAAT
jgi:hypothetical protein